MIERNLPALEENVAVRPASLRVRLMNWWLDKKLQGDFWSFLATSFLFDSGMFIFFLLYNLYLLDLGFHENFLGWTTGANSFGSIVGSLPCGLFAHRFGLRRTLLVCLSLIPAICAFRAVSTSRVALLALAFIAGVVSSLWAVAEAPVVAQITDDQNRAFGFSVIMAAGIGFGVLAGVIGGYLPKWFLLLPSVHTAVSSKRAALLVGCVLAALAFLPASRLKFRTETSVPAAEKRHYPRNRFVVRFFPALAIWGLATGAFNPFFNAYFSHGLGVPVERIGSIFAGAQLMQVLAILLAPVVFKRFGLVTGIVYTQFACAATLLWLATGSGGWVSGVAYASYTGFLWMSEPGMFTLLMTRVKVGERAGAAALNLLVMSVAQAISAAVAGVAFLRFGYPIVMVFIALVIFAAGVIFRLLLATESPEPASEPEGVCV